MDRENAEEMLFRLAVPVAEVEELTLIDVEYVQYRGRGLVRVYIDRPGGVTLDDCQRFSQHFGRVLDQEDPIAHAYKLEVSSPGLDKTLKKPEHFRYFAGRGAKIVTSQPLEGINIFTGLLKGMEEDQVLMDTGGDTVRIPLRLVASARLFPDI